jgi:hypothetical protein
MIAGTRTAMVWCAKGFDESVRMRGGQPGGGGKASGV